MQMIRILRHDVSRALRDMIWIPSERQSPDAAPDERDRQVENPFLKHGLEQAFKLDFQTNANDISKTAANRLLGTTPGLNFDGIGYNGYGNAPSDSNGAVGATQYVEWVNTEFAVYNKTTGALVMGPTPANTLWSNFGGLCQTTNLGDPLVVYDKSSARWVFTHHAGQTGGPYYECMAVSTGADATGTYNRYAIPLPNYFPDYPKMGVWADGYYLSVNEDLDVSPYTPVGPYVCAMDRNSMLIGASATAQCFQLSSTYGTLLPADLDGFTPPPVGSPNYFLSLGANAILLWQFHVDWNNPANTTLTGPTSISVASFNQACNGGICVPQLGSSQLLDSLGDRLMNRLAYRNFGSHESLVVNHSVHALTAPSHSAVRWYEIRNPAGAPVVYQQGTYSPDSSFRWMGSVATDRVGDIAVGYSVSSSNMNPAIRYTGRVPSDPLGTLEGEISIIEGTGSQTSVNRWGDYTTLAIDPVDDCTFWYVNQYLKTDGMQNWSTRIASFSFPSCTSTPFVTVSPSSLAFATQAVGTSSTAQSVTLSNNQNVALLINGIGFTGANGGDFTETDTCGTSLPAGGYCSINVSFAPTATGPRTATLQVSDNAGNSPQNASLTGKGAVGGIVSLSATSLTFGTQVVGTTSGTLPVTLTNTGTGSLTINSIAVTGTNNGDFAETNNCSSTLPAGANCTISVTFTPTAVGSRSASITITDDASDSPQNITLSGTGVAPVTLSANSLAFGSVTVGTTSSPKTVTLTNNQTVSLTNISVTVSGQFSQSNTCGSSISAGGKCSISVTFSPTSAGSQTGTVTITDSASNSPQLISVKGFGRQPVTLSTGQLNFGSQGVGTTSSPQTVTLTNNQNVTLNIASVGITGTNSGDFAQTNTCGSSVAAGGNCGISVTFTPTATGTRNATLKITDDALNSPQVVKLTGIGQ